MEQQPDDKHDNPNGDDRSLEEIATAEAPRRNFMVEALAAIIGGVVGLVPVVTGLLFFFDPLLRKKSDGDEGGGAGLEAEGFIKLDATLEIIPDDGTPQLVTVYKDKVDAWNKFLNQPIGTVWLRKKEDGSLVAFNTICPHLGCSVEHRQSQGDFYCPCHLSAFELDGEKKNPIPPRGMDALETKVQKEDRGNVIWVKYQNFRAAEHEKIPIS